MGDQLKPSCATLIGGKPCRFWDEGDGCCTDTELWVHKDTGDPICRMHPDAILRDHSSKGHLPAHAVTSLVNCVRGLLSAYDEGLRELAGNTNVAVVEHWLEQVESSAGRPVTVDDATGHPMTVRQRGVVGELVNGLQRWHHVPDLHQFVTEADGEWVAWDAICTMLDSLTDNQEGE